MPQLDIKTFQLLISPNMILFDSIHILLKNGIVYRVDLINLHVSGAMYSPQVIGERTNRRQVQVKTEHCRTQVSRPTRLAYQGFIHELNIILHSTNVRFQ